jgi:hypothetical protein
MSTPSYTPSPWNGGQLKAMFDALKQAGHTPYAARALLTDLLEADDVEVTPLLPSGWRLRLLRGDGVAIETADGILDSAQVWVRPRHAGHNVPPPTASDNPPAPVAMTDHKEQEAIVWLAAQLKADDSVKRDNFAAECCKKFRISAIVYRMRIWPAARKRAGLRSRSRPGPKKQRSASLEFGHRN